MGNFKTFDNTINYILGFLGFLGLVGNFLCTITLGRKEMRSNCFHQLCLGKIKNFLFICYFLHLCINHIDFSIKKIYLHSLLYLYLCMMSYHHMHLIRTFHLENRVKSSQTFFLYQTHMTIQIAHMLLTTTEKF